VYVVHGHYVHVVCGLEFKGITFLQHKWRLANVGTYLPYLTTCSCVINKDSTPICSISKWIDDRSVIT
jgi:hypothetical protein